LSSCSLIFTPSTMSLHFKEKTMVIVCMKMARLSLDVATLCIPPPCTQIPSKCHGYEHLRFEYPRQVTSSLAPSAIITLLRWWVMFKCPNFKFSLKHLGSGVLILESIIGLVNTTHWLSNVMIIYQKHIIIHLEKKSIMNWQEH